MAISLKKIALPAVLVALMVLWITRPSVADDESALVGKPAPQIDLTTLTGERANLAEMKGKVVVLDFWATWCPPCVKALPHVNKIANDAGLAEKGLVVWGVNAQEAEGKIKTFMQKNSFTFTVPIDETGETMKAFDVQGIPTQIVIGRDGVVKHVAVGYGGKEGDAKLDAVIDAALAQK